MAWRQTGWRPMGAGQKRQGRRKIRKKGGGAVENEAIWRGGRPAGAVWGWAIRARVDERYGRWAVAEPASGAGEAVTWVVAGISSRRGFRPRAMERPGPQQQQTRAGQRIAASRLPIRIARHIRSRLERLAALV